MSPKAAPRACPCHSGAPYTDCCGPLHQGTRPAVNVEALMRSRYAAFALGLGEYLVSTLASTHEDRALDPRLLAQQLSSAKHTFKYMGLRIVHTEDTGEGGTVLFVAKMFSKGADRSFAELSTFTREGGELRYASGALVAGPDLPKEEGALTPTWILAHAR